MHPYYEKQFVPCMCESATHAVLFCFHRPRRPDDEPSLYVSLQNHRCGTRREHWQEGFRQAVGRPHETPLPAPRIFTCEVGRSPALIDPIIAMFEDFVTASPPPPPPATAAAPPDLVTIRSRDPSEPVFFAHKDSDGLNFGLLRRHRGARGALALWKSAVHERTDWVEYFIELPDVRAMLALMRRCRAAPEAPPPQR